MAVKIKEVHLTRVDVETLRKTGIHFRPACLEETVLGRKENQKAIYWIADRPYVMEYKKKEDRQK